MERRHVLWTIAVIGIFSILLKQGWALRCYTCIEGTCPSASDMKETGCTTLLDTCFKFEGVVTQDEVLFQGYVTRGCAANSIMQQFTPGDIQPNKCTNVTGSRDPDPDRLETYTGRICLCDTDLCNTASASRSLYVVFIFFIVLSCLYQRI
ncbi:uncharacterized protein LOC129599112 [Paramacrobiotus metropolitanus]|uniref:uncharacterized protein LOC129599112 n=1 Tax=Paramacrobiotus metropolitanus TaxID=2943436 RepID=UPI002445BFBB|nr:uncharacterized protein LOC129599112 [Paramacrobiotus metropolitanus]